MPFGGASLSLCSSPVTLSSCRVLETSHPSPLFFLKPYQAPSVLCNLQMMTLRPTEGRCMKVVLLALEASS